MGQGYQCNGNFDFMMGVAKIGYISRQLIKHGRPSETPVALIRWGTRAEQDTLTGTLADIEDRVKARIFSRLRSSLLDRWCFSGST